MPGKHHPFLLGKQYSKVTKITRKILLFPNSGPYFLPLKQQHQEENNQAPLLYCCFLKGENCFSHLG